MSLSSTFAQQERSRQQVAQEQVIRNNEDDDDARKATAFIEAIHNIFPSLRDGSEYRALQAASQQQEIRQNFRAQIQRLLAEQEYARNNALSIDGPSFSAGGADQDAQMWRAFTWLAFAAEKEQTDCTLADLGEMLKPRYESGTDQFPRIVVARHIIPQRCFVYEDLVRHWLSERQMAHHVLLDWPLNSASVYSLAWPVWPTINDIQMSSRSMRAFAEYAEGAGTIADQRVAAYLRAAARAEENSADDSVAVPLTLQSAADARAHIVDGVWGTRDAEPAASTDEEFTLERWNEQRATETLWKKLRRFAPQSNERKEQYSRLLPATLDRLVRCGSNVIRDNLYAQGYVWEELPGVDNTAGEWKLLPTARPSEELLEEEPEDVVGEHGAIAFWRSPTSQSCYLEAWLVAALTLHRELLQSDDEYRRRIEMQETLDEREETEQEEEHDASVFPDSTTMLEKVSSLIAMGTDDGTSAQFDSLTHLDSSYYRSTLRWLVTSGSMTHSSVESLQKQYRSDLIRNEQLAEARAERLIARRFAARAARESARSSFIISVNPQSAEFTEDEDEDEDEGTDAKTFWQFLADSEYARMSEIDVDTLYRRFLQDESKIYAWRWFQRVSEGHFDPCNGNKLGLQTMHENFDAFMSTEDVSRGTWGIAASTTMLQPLPAFLQTPTPLPKPVPSPKWLPYGTRNPRALNGLDVTFSLQNVERQTQQADGSTRVETLTPQAFRALSADEVLDSTQRFLVSVVVQNNSSKTYQGGHVRVVIDVRQKDFVDLLARRRVEEEFESREQFVMFLSLQEPLIPGEKRTVTASEDEFGQIHVESPDAVKIGLVVKTSLPSAVLDSLVDASLRGQVLSFSPPQQTGYSVWTYSSIVSLQRNRLAKRFRNFGTTASPIADNMRDALLLVQPTPASAMMPYSRTVLDANGAVSRSVLIGNPKALTLFSDQMLAQIRFDEYMVVSWSEDLSARGGVYRLSAVILFTVEKSQFVTLFRRNSHWFSYSASENQGRAVALTTEEFRRTLYCRQNNVCQTWYTTVNVDQALPTSLVLDSGNSSNALLAANGEAQAYWRSLTAAQIETTVPTVSPPYVEPADKTTRAFLEREVVVSALAAVSALSSSASSGTTSRSARGRGSRGGRGSQTGRRGRGRGRAPRTLRATRTYSTIFVPFLYSTFGAVYGDLAETRRLVGLELWDRLQQIAQQHYRVTGTVLADLKPRADGYIPAHMQEWALGAPRTEPSPQNSPHYAELRQASAADGGGIHMIGHGDYSDLDLRKHLALAATVGTPLNKRAAQLAREGKI